MSHKARPFYLLGTRFVKNKKLLEMYKYNGTKNAAFYCNFNQFLFLNEVYLLNRFSYLSNSLNKILGNGKILEKSGKMKKWEP